VTEAEWRYHSGMRHALSWAKAARRYLPDEALL
jgi:hypothetical protein